MSHNQDRNRIMTAGYPTVIIGAGLSGLTAAYELVKKGNDDFIILEARDRIGGRIFTKDDIDLGATWFQAHHTKLISLLDELSVPKFRQFNAGKSVFIYSSMAPAEYFDASKSGPAAYRIGGGSIALIDALIGRIGNEKIQPNTTAISIREQADNIKITTNDGQINANKVIVAIPPKIAAEIEYGDEGLDLLTHTMMNTHTWMSNAIKVGISYREPFWRTKNLSGTIIGHVCPMIELYDHSNYKEDTFSLMGFANEGLRVYSPDDRKERILNHLEKVLGPEARVFKQYEEKDWSIDRYTSGEMLNSVYISPQYGNPIFQKPIFNNRLIFCSAETSPIHGGYMDGAIISGIRASEFVS